MLDQAHPNHVSSSSLNSIEALLKEAFPHGHPSFISNMVEKIARHSRKNHDYAAGGDPLGNFVRVAAFFSNYPKLSLADPKVIAFVQMLKQLDAVLWCLSNGHVLAEDVKERQGDVVVYNAIIEAMLGDDTQHR